MKHLRVHPLILVLAVASGLYLWAAQSTPSAPSLFAKPLLTGWWPSGARLWNVWHPSTTALWLFLAGVALLVGGAHWFIAWVWTAATAGSDAASRPRWRFKWTVVGFAATVCALTTIASLVLTVHQLYWFSHSTAPTTTDRESDSHPIVAAAHELFYSASKAGWTTDPTRIAFLTSDRFWLERFQIALIEERPGQLRAIILIPRHAEVARWTVFAVVQPEGGYTPHLMTELPRTLEAFGLVASDAANPGPAKRIGL